MMMANVRLLRATGAQLGAQFVTYAQALLALVGLAAVVVASIPESRSYVYAYLASSVQESEDKIPATAGNMTAGNILGSEAAGNAADQREQRALIEFIAKRYRVSDRAVSAFVSAAYRAGEEHSVDPVLILAVMAVESRYNPVAESLVGAKGLMQVIPKFHGEKLHEHGGEAALLDPEVNIYVGAQILREYMRRFGQLETALQVYGGAFDEPTFQYAGKVLAERARLDQILKRVRREA